MLNDDLFPASFSRLSLYETCALKMKFRYRDKLSTPKGPAASRGTLLHSSIEDYILGKKDTLHSEIADLHETFTQVKEDPKPFVELKLAFSEGFVKVVPWTSSQAHFRMVLDAGNVFPDKVVIREWKSGKMYDEHYDQRKTYALGSIIKWNLPVEVVTHYLDLRKQEASRGEVADRKVWAWHLTQRLETMANDRHFAPRPGHYCHWCDFSKRKGGPCTVA